MMDDHREHLTSGLVEDDRGSYKPGDLDDGQGSSRRSDRLLMRLMDEDLIEDEGEYFPVLLRPQLIDQEMLASFPLPSIRH